MSSHHFVREGQEPALLIIDPVPFEVAAGLLEWSPAVIASAECVEHVLTWGIKVDVVVGHESDVDRLRAQLIDFFPLKILAYPGKPGLLQTCFDFLAGQGQNELTIVTEDAYRIFPVLQNYLRSFGVVVHDEHTRWIPVFGSLEKWVPANTPFRTWQIDPVAPVFHDGIRESGGELISEHDGTIRLWSNDLFWVGQRL